MSSLVLKAIDLHMQGFSVLEISSRLEKTEGWIYKLFKQARYTLPKTNSAKSVKKLWTDSEIEFLRTNPNKTIQELASHLGRGYSSVKCKLSNLELHRNYFCEVCGEQLSQKGKYCSEHTWVGHSIGMYRHSMKTKHPNKIHTLTDGQMREMILADCVYCGGKGKGIDRIDSSLGYTHENTVSCCTRCNELKLNYNRDEWVDHMKKILKHLGECND